MVAAEEGVLMSDVSRSNYDYDYYDYCVHESAAEIVHDLWAHWMKYMFTLCEDDDLGFIIPHEYVRRWQRQMNTAYNDLSEKEKASDRDLALRLMRWADTRP